MKFTEQPKTRGIISKKKMALSEGNKLFAGDFRANLDETNADMVQFTKKMEVEMDFVTLRILLQKV